MQDLSQSRFASTIALLAGVWAMLSPIWITMSSGMKSNVIITGAIIALMSLIQLGWKNITPSWINALAAVWLFISGFMFNATAASTWSQVITAIVVFIMATWDGAEIAHFNNQHHASAM